MSFQDIEAGLAQRPLSPSGGVPQSAEESAFLGLQSSLSLQVFKINSNVQGILKLVDQLGTARDSPALRKSLHDLTEATRQMAKRGSEDLKKLTAMQATLPRYKTSLQKTSHDFQLSLVAFQRAQQVSVERQRIVVEGVKLAVEEEEAAAQDQNRASSPTPSQRQAQILHNQLSPQELAFQESLIQEREAEIREIETGIHELHEIFRDIGTLVQEQGGLIDNIESNISSIAVDTSGAAEELTTAHEYQRRAGRRALCLMLVLVVVVCVVLLARIRLYTFLASQLVTSVRQVVSLYARTHYDKIPYHTSALSGLAWLNELLDGHPERIKTELGVHKDVFIRLVETLEDIGYCGSRYVSLREQVAIFLYTCVTGLSVRHVGERFQRSNETIAKYFKSVLQMISGPEFYNRYVKLPSADDPIPLHISTNPKFYPYLKNVVGAMDGTHIACAPSLEERPASQWGRAEARPMNAQELFNLRHASARNVVERIFGILKRRFKILTIPCEFSMAVQARILPALCAIHNFIRIHDGDEINNFATDFYDPSPGERNGELGDGAASVAERERAARIRDQIAEEMWQDYQNVLERLADL
ncbi:hypothetical protein BN946_scf184647.g2 [Trametes cinnabarina]|uniref:t-SNARE coiled-coil homology domain-containing protein n=1 Tax=Pycnoporus cinnabarinus TaxID=5643 RepID=A0A060SPB9_PYCCI|nr:hypothetical protein BN946_scf184647.g2 [Trametes cinnabarina]